MVRSLRCHVWQIEWGDRTLKASAAALGERFRVEDVVAELDAVIEQSVGKLRTDTNSLEVALETTVFVNTHSVVKQEEVLKNDGVAFHALHFGDVRHTTGTITKAGQLHNDVNCRSHLFTNCTDGKVVTGHKG